ncbi:uncharacterized protein LOC143143522 [Ptiloglossa arizonensis]|uniref:uncharacterized protein LOC143143522 n=1 Tax=Ptiloglossa arizonensis TaxID=3350558 RepID=UPI003F9FAE52
MIVSDFACITIRCVILVEASSPYYWRNVRERLETEGPASLSIKLLKVSIVVRNKKHVFGPKCDSKNAVDSESRHVASGLIDRRVSGLGLVETLHVTSCNVTSTTVCWCRANFSTNLSRTKDSRSVCVTNLPFRRDRVPCPSTLILYS